MSVQFGRWNFDGQPVDAEYIAKVNALLAPYAPDGCTSHSAPGTTILYHAFHTTKESRREKQPHISNSGAVITWDGRLDNRSELIQELADVLTASSTDVEIVAAAYEEWGGNSFARLIGDWAVAIWDPGVRCLTLAKDPIGTRHLYYAVEEQRITWSTILDPLVLCASRKFQLCEEYIAGWLGFFPATHLTPYVGIDSVPPSCLVRLRPQKLEIRKYWDFDPHKRIRYRTDGEYEEHFRVAFGESVRRRLRSGHPVLAELSGGMDSSSIVCVADESIARGLAETSRLDTISYYDNSEPNWDERPYFTKVEQKRGRTGYHIDLNPQAAFRARELADFFPATPGSINAWSSDASQQFGECVASQGNRVVLSGLGGDEITGGVPEPNPELMDALVAVRPRLLSRQLKAWALAQRKPWVHLFFATLRGFFPIRLVGARAPFHPAPWLSRGIVGRHWSALTGYPARTKVLGAPPSFQDNILALNAVKRQIGSFTLPVGPCHEKRYPFLDRDFAAFMFAIPREQLLRPGTRRSLMRRSLAGIIPDELLNRRRKAFVARSPIVAFSSERNRSETNVAIMVRRGIIDPDSFHQALERTRRGVETHLVALLRSHQVEEWLRLVEKTQIALIGPMQPAPLRGSNVRFCSAARGA